MHQIRKVDSPRNNLTCLEMLPFANGSTKDPQSFWWLKVPRVSSSC